VEWSVSRQGKGEEVGEMSVLRARKRSSEKTAMALRIRTVAGRVLALMKRCWESRHTEEGGTKAEEHFGCLKGEFNCDDLVDLD